MGKLRLRNATITPRIVKFFAAGIAGVAAGLCGMSDR